MLKALILDQLSIKGRHLAATRVPPAEALEKQAAASSVGAKEGSGGEHRDGQHQ